MPRLAAAALAGCCLSLAACGSSSAPPLAPAVAPSGLFTSDREAIRDVRTTTSLYADATTRLSALIEDRTVGGDALAVGLNADRFRTGTLVERVAREAELLRTPALQRGMRKVIRIFREQNQQYALAGNARLAADPTTTSASLTRASELAAESEQTLTRLVGRYPEISG